LSLSPLVAQTSAPLLDAHTRDVLLEALSGERAR
jgi:hypothetical protein